MKYPSRTAVYQNGQPYITSQVVSFKPLTRVDAREFAVTP
jgi:hypothetical protein